jgi:pfkB family carbohydrate kinase
MHSLAQAAVHCHCAQVSHVQQSENWAVIEKAKVIYSAGFFITVSPEAIAATSKHAAAADKIYAMNLSAPFIMQVTLAYRCRCTLVPCSSPLVPSRVAGTAGTGAG